MSTQEHRIRLVYERLRHALQDPTRRSARGPARYAYTEAQFARKLRREACMPLVVSMAACDESSASMLVRGQLVDLLNGLELTPRQREVALLRYDGYTIEEVAERLSISTRRVCKIMACVRFAMGDDLRSTEGRLRPGAVPYYGWQQAYLESVRRGGVRVRRRG